jgi:hypothetical protein
MAYGCFNGCATSKDSHPGLPDCWLTRTTAGTNTPRPTTGFFVGEDGTPTRLAGNGSGGFTALGLGGLQAQVSVHAGTWSAELYIPSGLLGGWNHPVGLDLVAIYNYSFSTGNVTLPNAVGIFAYPYVSLIYAPNTWAWTLLGTPPAITSLNPEKATAGGLLSA